MAEKGLNNEWHQLLNVGTHSMWNTGSENFSGTDLDGLVREYSQRRDDQKAPVRLGVPDQAVPGVFGKIDALRRKGDSLEGRFSGVDPRVEHLHGRGVFSKKSVQVKRAPEGDSLASVGLIAPVYNKSVWHDDKTPPIEELMKTATGEKTHVFAEAPLAGRWIEIFRAGDYGEKGVFTTSDVDSIVKNLDTSFHEPPVVIGHPVHNAPAYGWVEELKRTGDVLMGKLKQVDPSFEAMVNSGRFKKRSASFYETAKGKMLRHVGFLGAQPPEVKGLAPVSFSEDSPRFITLTFDDSRSTGSNAVARLKSGGYWIPYFDRSGLPLLFSELETSVSSNAPAAWHALIQFIEWYLDESGFDPGSVRLSKRAENYASSHAVSYGEALRQVSIQGEQDVASAETIVKGMRGAELSRVAESVARTRGISFCEALTIAAQENPELTTK